jgi:hypothetical protein
VGYRPDEVNATPFVGTLNQPKTNSLVKSLSGHDDADRKRAYLFASG